MTNRQPFLDMVARYDKALTQGTWQHATYDEREERAILEKFRRFVTATADCFERTSPRGHVTGSAMVVSQDLSEVLLTHHKKLNKWLQLGGHSDGSPDTADVAWREVEEESGLKRIAFVLPAPFDYDWHDIPARKTEPAHIHYDVRFLIRGDRTEPLAISDESNDLRWFKLADARLVTAERSMHRQFDKIEALRARL